MQIKEHRKDFRGKQSVRNTERRRRWSNRQNVKTGQVVHQKSVAINLMESLKPMNYRLVHKA